MISNLISSRRCGPLLRAAALLVVTSLAGAVSVLLTPSAGAAQSDDFATIEIQTKGPISWDSGRQVDATVTITTERAVSGTLSIVDDPDGRSTTTFEFDIDLAANSSAVLPVTLTTGWDGLRATGVLRTNGDVVAEDRFEEFFNGNAQVDVGLVATFGIDSPPQRVPEIGSDDQAATLVLDSGLRGLDRASSLVANPGAIRALGVDSRERLMIDGWVQGGGQLIVDGPTASLDDEYHRFPTANPARFSFGAGSIVYLDDWTEGVPLGGYVGAGGLRQLVENQGLGAGASGELGILANISLPGVAMVAGVLLVYSLLAGPLLFGLLSAKRALGRIWLILPLLSFGFAAGIVGVGLVTRQDTSEAHITIVEVNQRGSRATSNLLLASNFGGSREVETPAGWSYLGQGQINAQRPVQLRVGATSTQISIDMPPGSNSLARLSGIAPQFDGSLTIEDARLEGDQITAEVVNNSGADLVEAVAFLGNGRTEIGDLPSGTRTTFSVQVGDHSGRTMKELLIWPAVRMDWGNNGPVAVPQDRNASTAAGAWTEWRISQGTTATPDNVLGVAAWTDDLTGPVPGVPEGRTALFVRSNIADLGSGTQFSTVARLPNRQQPVFDGNFSGYIEEYRVTLGRGYDLDRLAVGVLDESSRLSVLTEDGWLNVELPESGGVDVTIPEQAVIDGEIRFRSYVPEWVWGIGATALVVADSDDAVAAKLSDQQVFRTVNGGFEADMEFDAIPDPGQFGGGDMVPRGLAEGELTVLADLSSAQPFSVSSSIDPQSHHAFVVSLVEGQSLVATMSSNRGDSYLELVGPDGELLVSNDDYGRNVDSQIQFTAAEAADYEIRAMDLSSARIDYQFVVEVSGE